MAAVWGSGLGLVVTVAGLSSGPSAVSLKSLSEPLKNKDQTVMYATGPWYLFLKEPSVAGEHRDHQGRPGFRPAGPSPLFQLGSGQGRSQGSSKFTSVMGAAVMPSWMPRNTQQDVTQDSGM